MKSTPLILFLHIPKTAGTTLYRIMQNQYPNQFWVWTPQENIHIPINLINTDPNNTYKCFYGHFVYGLHQHFLRPSIYITLLRNPIERVISEYYFILKEPMHAPYIASQIAANQMSLEDYVKSTDRDFQLRTCNMQTRFLSGVENPQFGDYLTAKNNLQGHFIIGIAERFDESLFFFQRKLGWSPVKQYQSKFVSDKRPTSKSISPEVLKIIEEKNKLDCLLYYDACELFQQQIDMLDAATYSELQHFIKNINK